MKTKAAVLWDVSEPWSIEEVDLDGPGEGEVLVAFEASGLCHSDHSVRTGDLPGALPMVGGHEGAGIVQEVGPGVTGLRVGDRVITFFLPVCGRCRWCSTGRQTLCDLGAHVLGGTQLDGTYRRHVGDRDIGALCMLGTFAQYGTVSQYSVIKIDDDIPMASAALLSCGVPTGWGSAVNTARVQPGDTVIVIGCGGIGGAAIQGARLAGAEHIVVVDNVETKRDMAFRFGATHFSPSMSEASAAVSEMTRGVMADSALLTVGLIESPMVGEALDLVRKGGSVVLTALAPMTNSSPVLNMTMFTMFQKRLLGSLCGEVNPLADIPRLLGLYRNGKLLLDEMVTTEYELDDVNLAYADTLAGNNIRGVIRHDR